MDSGEVAQSVEPLATAPEIGSEAVVDFDVVVPMRDGVELRADVYRPNRECRHPVLLQRTPYGKAAKETTKLMLDIVRAVRAGYAVVIQDVRGRYGSAGEFEPFLTEVDDGFDTVEWCGVQSWSDGNVGMFGMSYVGATQWLAAIARPSCLRAIFPQLTCAGAGDTWTHQGGAFSLGLNLSWTMTSLAPDEFRRARAEDPALTDPYHRMIGGINEMAQFFEVTPLQELTVFDPVAPYYREWLRHGPDSDYWHRVALEGRYDQVTVPVHSMGGWYDSFLAGTLRNFVGVREQTADPDLRAAHRLTIGPWHHVNPLTHLVGDWNFGVRSSPASVDIDGMQIAWFDRWLKGEDVRWKSDAPVRLFVMGTDEWVDAEDWPLPGTSFVEWRLGGQATADAGTLGPTVEPTGSDAYLSDPADPVPTRGGGLCCWPALLPGGVFDQTLIEARDDVLVYTSEPLAESLTVIGPVTAVLYISSTGPSADFFVKLVDVSPDGYARNLCDGIFRWNRDEGGSGASPGVHRIEVDMIATANVFEVGHRIRVDVSSSCFPRFDRNPQTGDWTSSPQADFAVHEQTIHHSVDRLSHVVLPVIPALT